VTHHLPPMTHGVPRALEALAANRGRGRRSNATNPDYHGTTLVYWLHADWLVAKRYARLDGDTLTLTASGRFLCAALDIEVTPHD
jgi:hypothetical protein